MKKLFAMLLAIAMLLSMAACVKPQDETVTYKDPYADLADDYDALSAAIYADVLGEFKTAYDAAKAATTVSERYALMAIAEAKLMESGMSRKDAIKQASFDLKLPKNVVYDAALKLEI